MRINKKKFPILDILRMSKEEFAEKKPLEYGHHPKIVDEKADWTIAEDFFKNNIERIGELLKFGSVEMVSSNFIVNVFKNPKMFDKLDVKTTLMDVGLAGVMMMNIHTGMTYVYDFRDPLNSYFILLTDGNIVTHIVGYKNGSLDYGIADSFRVEGRTISTVESIFDAKRLLEYTLLFKHYAKVETIHVKPKEKARDPNSKEKHFNETDIPINILDCRWFNNIVRDEPFGVRGHFRLQPKKDASGKWIKELIYIKPFIKQGYNLKARKSN